MINDFLLSIDLCEKNAPREIERPALEPMPTETATPREEDFSRAPEPAAPLADLGPLPLAPVGAPRNATPPAASERSQRSERLDRPGPPPPSAAILEFHSRSWSHFEAKSWSSKCIDPKYCLPRRRTGHCILIYIFNFWYVLMQFAKFTWSVRNVSERFWKSNTAISACLSTWNPRKDWTCLDPRLGQHQEASRGWVRSLQHKGQQFVWRYDNIRHTEYMTIWINMDIFDITSSHLRPEQNHVHSSETSKLHVCPVPVTSRAWVKIEDVAWFSQGSYSPRITLTVYNYCKSHIRFSHSVDLHLVLEGVTLGPVNEGIGFQSKKDLKGSRSLNSTLTWRKVCKACNARNGLGHTLIRCFAAFAFQFNAVSILQSCEFARTFHFCSNEKTSVITKWCLTSHGEPPVQFHFLWQEGYAVARGESCSESLKHLDKHMQHTASNQTIRFA